MESIDLEKRLSVRLSIQPAIRPENLIQQARKCGSSQNMGEKIKNKLKAEIPKIIISK